MPGRRAPRRGKGKAFPASLVAAIDKRSYLKVRSGTTHRFTAIWSVVVDGRVFVRSWYLRPGGWFYSFLAEPLGSMQVDGVEVRVRGRRVRGERVKDAVSGAYAHKYVTPASIKYVKGFARGRRRDATIELLPA